MGIFLLEHSDLFVGAAPYNKEMHRFKSHFKEDDEDFVSNEELHREVNDDFILLCFQFTYEADWQAAKQLILERRFFERIPKTPIMIQVPDVAETLNLIFFILNLNYFIAYLRICLHTLAPSSNPIKKSPTIATVNQLTTITVSNLSFNIVIV